jgi:hypothetical protein
MGQCPSPAAARDCSPPKSIKAIEALNEPWRAPVPRRRESDGAMFISAAARDCSPPKVNKGYRSLERAPEGAGPSAPLNPMGQCSSPAAARDCSPPKSIEAIEVLNEPRRAPVPRRRESDPAMFCSAAARDCSPPGQHRLSKSRTSPGGRRSLDAVEPDAAMFCSAAARDCSPPKSIKAIEVVITV